jgi:AcrR family transcriptional regulator
MLEGFSVPEQGDKQVNRRSAIESEAWLLMAERGYDGLTMRELSRRTGLSTRTLYEMYGGKDALLAEAFQERLRMLFARFESEISAKGLAHLTALNREITASITRGENFSRAYASILASNKISIYSIETPVTHFRACLEEIREEGDLQDWVDTRFAARRLLLGQNALMIQWGSGAISSANLDPLYDLSSFEILHPMTRGATCEELEKRLQELHQQLAPLDHF